MTGVACRAIAGCFAMAAFAVAVLAGLAGGNSASLILLRAVIAMLACYPAGLLVGGVCRHVLRRHAPVAPPTVPLQSAKTAEESEDVLVV